jgi:hypothetical protein
LSFPFGKRHGVNCILIDDAYEIHIDL